MFFTASSIKVNQIETELVIFSFMNGVSTRIKQILFFFNILNLKKKTEVNTKKINAANQTQQLQKKQQCQTSLMTQEQRNSFQWPTWTGVCVLSQIYACTGCWCVSVTHALFLFFQPHLLWFPSQERFHGLWHPGGSLEGACCGGLCFQTSRGKPWRELSRSRNISANQTGRNLPVNWDLKIPRYSY